MIVGPKEIDMLIHAAPMAHRPHPHEPDAPEPGGLPVEPDQGPVPPILPDDGEHDGVVDPEA